jgi:hypothetical protein
LDKGASGAFAPEWDKAPKAPPQKLWARAA